MEGWWANVSMSPVLLKIDDNEDNTNTWGEGRLQNEHILLKYGILPAYPVLPPTSMLLTLNSICRTSSDASGRPKNMWKNDVRFTFPHVQQTSPPPSSPPPYRTASDSHNHQHFWRQSKVREAVIMHGQCMFSSILIIKSTILGTLYPAVFSHLSPEVFALTT